MLDSKDILDQAEITREGVSPAVQLAYSEEDKPVGFGILMQLPPIRAVNVGLDSDIPQIPSNGGRRPTDRATLQLEGFPKVCVTGNTVDLPISNAGGSYLDQSPLGADKFIGLTGFRTGLISEPVG